MKAIKFEESIIINERPERVFDITQDYGMRLQWDTFLKRADLLDGATEAGKGVSAYCVAHNGLGMVTEYITFNRPEVTAPFTLLSGLITRKLQKNVRQRLVDLKRSIEQRQRIMPFLT